MPYAHALRPCPTRIPYAHALRPFSTPMPCALALHQCTTPLLRLCPTPMAYTHALRPTHPCPTLMGAHMSILPVPYAQALSQCATLNTLRQPLRPSPLPMLYAHGAHMCPTPMRYAHASTQPIVRANSTGLGESMGVGEGYEESNQ